MGLAEADGGWRTGVSVARRVLTSSPRKSTAAGLWDSIPGPSLSVWYSVSTQTRGHRGKCTNSRFIRQWQGVKSKAESPGG